MRRRRRIAVGLLVVVLLVAGVSEARRHWPGAVRTGSAAAHGARILRYDVRSRFVHRTLPQVAAVPRGGGSARRPLLVFLHGRGSDGQESNANGDFFAALAALGTRAPAVVFPSGGESSYWHPRADGDWARYVLDEVIPQAIKRLHADPRRVAIGGISMGGYGAFEIARLRPTRFCAVGGHSPALWLQAGDSAAGAFDDAEDYGHNDVLAIARKRGRAAWGTARLWLDGGTQDPFRSGGDAFAAALGIHMRHWPGKHEGNYWRTHYASYLGFYASALANC
ncbi:MAG TPA: alpha/beta hydrolase-fold protein [Solirubrobacteraceae bacterium]|nr:alpha/beta hydrolase-fold protein [Solirubrobacteraceae bacterium]